LIFCFCLLTGTFLSKLFSIVFESYHIFDSQTCQYEFTKKSHFFIDNILSRQILEANYVHIAQFVTIFGISPDMNIV